MNIYIAGGGRIGFHLARLLSLEEHSVTVLDADANRCREIDYALDVQTIHGNAESALILQESGAPNADLFVSMTGDDEVNLIAAAIAKGLGAAQTVARVEKSMYLEGSMLYEASLGIDFLLSPDALTAIEIAEYVQSPGMLVAEQFSRGRVKMRQMRITRLQHKSVTVKDLSLPPGVLVALIRRGSTSIIPHGDSRIAKGDVVMVIGQPGAVDSVQKTFGGTEPKPQKVAIMGGGDIGAHLAHLLENDHEWVKVFDNNEARCKDLAGRFTRAEVLCEDATRKSALEQEFVAEADVFVATTSDDERNIMGSLLAREVGAGQAICVVHQPDFAELVQKLGIDHTVTPRACMANRIMRLVHQKEFSSLAILEEGRVELVEFTIKEGNPVINVPLQDMHFPGGALVVAILRGKDVIVPGGGDTLRAGDSVIVVTAPEVHSELRKLFRL